METPRCCADPSHIVERAAAHKTPGAHCRPWAGASDGMSHDCHGLPSACVTQGVAAESPLPLWERERVRGLAPAGADESVAGERNLGFGLCVADIARSCRAAARVPSPCPSPTRGEGTLQDNRANCWRCL